MRRLLHAGLVLFILISLLVPALSQPWPSSAAPKKPPPRGPLAKPANLPAYKPDEILVEFKAGIRPDVVAQAVGARVHGEIKDLGVHILKVPHGTVEATLRSLDRNPLVEFAEPNGSVFAFAHGPNDPYDDDQCYVSSYDGCVSQSWYWQKVQAYAAWAIPQPWSTGSCSVKVAVVDTGIDVGGVSFFGVPDTPHPDLNSCGITVVSEIPYESGNDDNGHGTHIAGVIGAKTNNNEAVAGGNWSVNLLGVKVLYYDGSGYWSDVADGVRKAANNGAKVINLSLGGPTGSRTVKKAVDYAWSKGAVLACAAGNDGTTKPSYPAYYSNCVAVAASDPNDLRASWSTYGTWVDVAAPGVAILSTIQDNYYWCFLCYGLEYPYQTYLDALSGTSMATSFVSALAALVWASGVCGTSNACVRNRIEGLAYTDNNGTYGIGTGNARGRVNFYKALTVP